MNRLRDKMTAPSRLRYLVWRLLKLNRPVAVQIAKGPKLILRPKPTTDLGVAMEIFVYQMYQIPDWIDSKSVRIVMDLGGNVGFSCLYWLSEFPDAHVTVFEPHPAHLTQINSNLRLNGWRDRVSVHGCAAGISNGTLHLVDDGCRSHTVPNASANAIPVPVEDWFTHVNGKRLDLLKIDIEGGEFALLEDSRFEHIEIGAIVLEWHKQTGRLDAQYWCRNRLEELGYVVTDAPIHPDNGLIWAKRIRPL